MFFFFNDTATTEIYTLSLHDALPIWLINQAPRSAVPSCCTVDLRDPSVAAAQPAAGPGHWSRISSRASRAKDSPDRKSTRLNSSHANISYAVFCLKKKKQPATTSSST